MASHDFRSLNDKDFESLCVDVLGEFLGVRLERFKAGKDRGVDGRYFSPSGREVVLQAKHRPKSTVSAIVNHLSKVEAPKVKSLNPERYLLALSIELSRQDKERIAGIFDSYLKPSDIFGLEDINDLLDAFPAVERKHYKLWIRSSGVLSTLLNHGLIGRSAFAVEQMRSKADRYVVTDSHRSAAEVLERLGVVIVTGEPGVGKTTLAEQLCLSLIAEGYGFVQIHSDIHEGDSVFSPGERQVFYFDDFLGRNYLAAVLRNEGSAITQFISRVASDRTKRLVITSRSGILNQGRLLMDVLGTSRAKKNDFELRISELSMLDRGKILYQHIWASGLSLDLIEEIYRDRRYRVIVEHENFNPRLIEFITDPSNLEQLDASEYWGFITRSLSSPAEVWAHAFDMQLDDYSRALVSLVVMNGRSISEIRLREAYRRFLVRPGRAHMSGRQDFGQSLRILVGSLLNRRVSEVDAVIDLFNPSVGDFVLGRLKQDSYLISDCLVALRSISSLLALDAMARNAIVTSDQVSGALSAAIDAEISEGFASSGGTYLSTLFHVASFRCRGLLVDRLGDFDDALEAALNDGSARFSSDLVRFLRWGVENGRVAAGRGLEMLVDRVSEFADDADFEAGVSLVATCNRQGAHSEGAWQALTNELIKMVGDDIDSFVEVNEVISEHGPGEYAAVEYAIGEKLKDKFQELGVPFGPADLERALEGFNVWSTVDHYFENERDVDYEGYIPTSRVSRPVFDELDDLFDRG